MIKDRLKRIYEENKEKVKSSYLRTLLKEAIQDYILNFVYNHPQYKNLIFTGGTCMRKLYKLPRLSEDLDFNFLADFNTNKFKTEIGNYFFSKLQFRELDIKIAHNQRSLYLKFPVMHEIGFAKTPADSPLLFVRCDFTKEATNIYNTEIRLVSTEEFTFFVTAYDLPTLFANKIVAFLQREFFTDDKQKIPFKGRDVFDLIWFFEQAARNNLQPNWNRAYVKLNIDNKNKILQEIVNKLEQIDSQYLKIDLESFISSPQSIISFSENYLAAIKSSLKYLK